MDLCRVAATVAVAVLLVEGFHADEPKLHSVWRLHDGSQLNFAGQKVAALVITDDLSLQMSGEEALARELNSRSVTGVATYRFAPREELKTAAKARTWFEKAGVAGVVVLRPVAVEREKVYSPVVWASGYCQSVLGLLRLRLDERRRGEGDRHAHDGGRRDARLRPETRQARLGRDERDQGSERTCRNSSASWSAPP